MSVAKGAKQFSRIGRAIDKKKKQTFTKIMHSKIYVTHYKDKRSLITYN